MKLALKAVESVGTSNWSEDAVKGTLSENLDKGDKLAFSDKNLRSDKQIAVFVHEKGNDTPKLLACSAQLSSLMRKALAKGKSKKELFRVLLGLRIVEATTKSGETAYFIVLNGGVGELFSLDDITKAEKIDYEELVAF